MSKVKKAWILRLTDTELANIYEALEAREISLEKNDRNIKWSKKIVGLSELKAANSETLKKIKKIMKD